MCLQQVLYFEGRQDLSTALAFGSEDLKNKELLCFYAKGPAGSRSIPGEYYSRLADFKKKKIRIRGIAPDHQSLRKFRDTADVRWEKVLSLPLGLFSSEVSIEIGEKFVRLIFHKHTQATIINNEDFAKTMQEIFEMIWKEQKKR